MEITLQSRCIDVILAHRDQAATVVHVLMDDCAKQSVLYIKPNELTTPSGSYALSGMFNKWRNTPYCLSQLVQHTAIVYLWK